MTVNLLWLENILFDFYVTVDAIESANLFWSFPYWNKEIVMNVFLILNQIKTVYSLHIKARKVNISNVDLSGCLVYHGTSPHSPPHHKLSSIILNNTE